MILIKNKEEVNHLHLQLQVQVILHLVILELQVMIQHHQEVQMISKMVFNKYLKK